MEFGVGGGNRTHTARRPPDFETQLGCENPVEIVKFPCIFLRSVTSVYSHSQQIDYI